MLKLSQRLKALANLVPQGKRAADIGTDHGLLPCYLITEKISPYVIAVDMNKGPLEAARSNIERYNLNGLVDLRLGDGLETLKPYEADVIIIAGLGGGTIVDILKGSSEVANTALKLIFQPMTGSEAIRSWLQDNSWAITQEDLIYEDGRVFEIIAAEKGKMGKLSQAETLFGPILIKRKHPYLSILLQKELTSVQEIIDQLAKSNSKEAKEKSEIFQKREEMIKGLLRCLSAANQ